MIATCHPCNDKHTSPLQPKTQPQFHFKVQNRAADRKDMKRRRTTETRPLTAGSSRVQSSGAQRQFTGFRVSSEVPFSVALKFHPAGIWEIKIMKAEY